jgi:hypothetical protein
LVGVSVGAPAVPKSQVTMVVRVAQVLGGAGFALTTNASVP